METSDDWKTVCYEDQTTENNPTKIAVEHRQTGAQIMLKELPSGYCVLKLNIPSVQYGGYETVHSKTLRSLSRAVSEAERYAAMYDTEETWLIDGAPVLH